MQAVVDRDRVLPRVLELIGGVDLDGERQRLVGRPVDAIGVAAAAAAAAAHRNRPLHLRRVVLKDDDRRLQLGELVGHQPALLHLRAAREFTRHRSSASIAA
jgi:hypothetical protein